VKKFFFQLSTAISHDVRPKKEELAFILLSSTKPQIDYRISLKNIYFERCLIFLLLRLSLRIRFFLHFARIT